MGDHPFDRVVAALEAAGCRFNQRRRPDQVRVRCPSHPDKRPSLVVTRKPDRVLLHCFAGCKPDEVLTKLGLSLRDLFLESRPNSGPVRRQVATYRYLDANGKLVAEKVRFDPKIFRWRSPDPQRNGRISWGLHGCRPSLYCLERA